MYLFLSAFSGRFICRTIVFCYGRGSEYMHILRNNYVHKGNIGLNLNFDHNMIHTIVIHAYLYRIWSKALWLILTISTYCRFIDIECIPKIEM